MLARSQGLQAGYAVEAFQKIFQVYSKLTPSVPTKPYCRPALPTFNS
jgi:hypothetical protein